MIDLVANLDHVAVLRDKRRGNAPDPVAAAVVVEMAGAAGVSVQLRGDRQYTQDRDVRILREMVKTRLHLALAPNKDAVKFAYAVKPNVVTLVPDRRDEIASSIGVDVLLNQNDIKKLIRALKEVGVFVSILIDPDVDQVKASRAAEADGVLLNTRLYSDSGRERDAEEELERIETAARIARTFKLKVAAGHGLDYSNVAPVARIPQIGSIQIGHALIARSLFCGLDEATRQMLSILRDARPPQA